MEKYRNFPHFFSFNQYLNHPQKMCQLVRLNLRTCKQKKSCSRTAYHYSKKFLDPLNLSLICLLNALWMPQRRLNNVMLYGYI